MRATLELASFVSCAILSALMVRSAPALCAGEDPFTNPTGVASGDLVAPFGIRFGGMNQNPGGAGHLLLGAYYDVRVLHDARGTTDVQQTLLTIRNVSPADPSDPEYDPNRGILVRLGLRESSRSLTGITFPVALGCGQTWNATIFRGSEGVPRIRSADPVPVLFTGAGLTTAPLFAGHEGIDFRAIDVFLGAQVDLSRGFIEVIAMEALPCQPRDPPISPAGNLWDRLPHNLQTPPNSLAGEVTVAQLLRDTAFNYEMTAISRFVAPESGSITPLIGIFGDVQPTLSDCIAYFNRTADGYLSVDCSQQINLTLSRSRLRVRFQAPDGETATRLVLSTPTKVSSCFANGPQYPGTSFSCAPGGEKVAISIQSDLGKVRRRRTIRLPRAMSILAIGPRGDPTADVSINTKGLRSGWVEFDFAYDRKGKRLHAETHPSDFLDFLGAGVRGYEGLPILALGMQRGGLNAGPTYAFTPSSEVRYLTD